MKKSIMFLFFIISVIGVQGQSSQLGFYGGYATSSQQNMTPGLDLGFEFRKYFNENLYLTALFHFDETRGYASKLKHPQADVNINNVSYSSNYTSLGIGMGYKLHLAEQHSIYAQVALGLSNIDRVVNYNIIDDLTLIEKYPPSKHPFYRTELSTSVLIGAGYDFKLFPWMALGIQYTLTIPDKYINHGFSAKVSFLFD